MNRNNFWIHFCIAVIVVAFAAVLGQLRLWQSKPFFSTNTATKSTPKPIAPKRSTDERQPEILVKFRAGVSLAEIRKIAAKHNDRVEDNLENIKGWTSIDDLDNKDMETVAEQYRRMSDIVLYAQPNYEIKLDDPANSSTTDLLVRENASNSVLPNDPMFKDTKTVFTVYNNSFSHKFDGDLLSKVKMIDIEDKMLQNLKSADFEGFIKIGMEYADIVIKAEEAFSEDLNHLFNEFESNKKIDFIETDANFTDSYYNLYNELVN